MRRIKLLFFFCLFGQTLGLIGCSESPNVVKVPVDTLNSRVDSIRVRALLDTTMYAFGSLQIHGLTLRLLHNRFIHIDGAPDSTSNTIIDSTMEINQSVFPMMAVPIVSDSLRLKQNDVSLSLRIQFDSAGRVTANPHWITFASHPGPSGFEVDEEYSLSNISLIVSADGRLSAHTKLSAAVPFLKSYFYSYSRCPGCHSSDKNTYSLMSVDSVAPDAFVDILVRP